MAASLKTITAASQIGFFNNGPFSIGGDLYAMTGNQSAACHAWRSVDAGATWSELDAGHAPVTSSTFPAFVFDGTKFIWAITSQLPGPVIVAIPFDTTANTWGTPVMSILPASDTNQPSCFYRRFDNQILIVTGVAIPNQCIATLFNVGGSTFSAYVVVGDSASIAFGCFGDSIGSLTYVQLVEVSTTGNVNIQSIDGSGILGALTPVFTAGGADFAFAPYCDGTNVIIALADPVSINVIVFEAPLSTLAFVQKTFAVPGLGIPADFIGTTSIIGGKFSVFVEAVFTGGTFSLYLFQDSGGGFGAGTLLIDLGASEVFTLVAAPITGLPGGYGLLTDAEPPVSFLFFSSTTTSTKGVVAAGQILELPTIGSICRFDRDLRPSMNPPRMIVIGKSMTYPIGYVR